jgi:hypothetical protein
MKQTIKGCARCKGEGHNDLEFEELKHPMQIDLPGCPPTMLATHWAMCPTVNQPIMLILIDPSTGKSS